MWYLSRNIFINTYTTAFVSAPFQGGAGIPEPSVC